MLAHARPACVGHLQVLAHDGGHHACRFGFRAISDNPHTADLITCSFFREGGDKNTVKAFFLKLHTVMREDNRNGDLTLTRQRTRRRTGTGVLQDVIVQVGEVFKRGIDSGKLSAADPSQYEVRLSSDATDLPISKSGSTAHFEAPVVASRIASLVRGTAPKVSYGGKVMCFLETGGRKSTVLRFDYENPPVPPKPSTFWHIGKWMFNRLYWVTVPQGRIPEKMS